MGVYMKNLIFFIFCCVSLLWSQPKVVGIFGNDPWSKELRDDVWDTPSFQVLLTQAHIAKEEQTVGPNVETPVLALYSSQGEEIGRLGFLLIPTEKYIALFQE